MAQGVHSASPNPGEAVKNIIIAQINPCDISRVVQTPGQRLDRAGKIHGREALIRVSQKAMTSVINIWITQAVCTHNLAGIINAESNAAHRTQGSRQW
jgi:hypothetical protein